MRSDERVESEKAKKKKDFSFLRHDDNNNNNVKARKQGVVIKKRNFSLRERTGAGAEKTQNAAKRCYRSLSLHCIYTE